MCQKCDLFQAFLGAFPIYLGERFAEFDKKEKERVAICHNVWVSTVLGLHRIWCRMSLAGFPFQRFANGLLDGRDREGILF